MSKLESQIQSLVMQIQKLCCYLGRESYAYSEEG